MQIDPLQRVRGARNSYGPRGSVTAETAVLLPVLLVVLAAAIGVLASVAAQLRCVDAARAAARVAARGDTPALVRTTAERLAPAGAAITLRSAGDTVEVVVTAQVWPFGRALGGLAAVPVSGRAVAAVEGPAP
ncbi:MAG: TadE family type IV pilus minor pilin [Mycobacteriales bacterium]